MGQLDTAILNSLQAICGEGRVLTDEESLRYYGRDWTRFYEPSPCAVVLPASIEEVQSIVGLAAEQHVIGLQGAERFGQHGRGCSRDALLFFGHGEKIQITTIKLSMLVRRTKKVTQNRVFVVPRLGVIARRTHSEPHRPS